MTIGDQASRRKRQTKTAAAETTTTEGSTTATPTTAEAAATTAKTNSKGTTAKEIQTQQETKGDQPQYLDNMKEKHITPKTKSRQIIIAGDSIIKGLKG